VTAPLSTDRARLVALVSAADALLVPIFELASLSARQTASVAPLSPALAESFERLSAEWCDRALPQMHAAATGATATYLGESEVQPMFYRFLALFAGVATLAAYAPGNAEDYQLSHDGGYPMSPLIARHLDALWGRLRELEKEMEEAEVALHRSTSTMKGAA
jgi:hypothetical protein